MSNEVAALEAEVKEYMLQLETVQSSLQSDPDNSELQNLKEELEEVITLTKTAIAELKPATATASSSSSYQPKRKPSPPPVIEKWSKEDHPAYKAGYRPPASATIVESPIEEAPQTPTTFSVNDNVIAKWKSGDKAFYPAKITSITGSKLNPIYIVSFKNYGTTETLSSHDIRPISNNGDSKKRKADGSISSSASTPLSGSGGLGPPPNSNVISAAASIDPTLASQAKREPSKVSDGPARPAKVPRKVKANKELEAGKNKWQDFTSKGKLGKVAKKDSMFRTGESVNARVGFTGSGQEMRKDPTRSRHIYKADGEDEN
ncbi:hypothetical protein MMC25_007257 [Agyrium rufum]|nr:hypothetical protein [Agyrium rufum]